MLMRGHASPDGVVGGNAVLASVHGQPVVPRGGGGRSRRLGLRIQTSGSARGLTAVQWKGCLGQPSNLDTENVNYETQRAERFRWQIFQRVTRSRPDPRCTDAGRVLAPHCRSLRNAKDR